MQTDATSKAARQRERLVSSYRALPPLEQEIVQLFSIAYQPVSRSTFVSCCGAARLCDTDGKTLVSKTVKPLLYRLLAEELLIQEPGQGPRCHPLLAEVATRDALRSSRFSAMVDAVETRMPIDGSWKYAPRYFANSQQFLREVRIGIYTQHLEFINQQFEAYQQHGYRREPVAFEDIAQRVSIILSIRSGFAPYQTSSARAS